MTTSGLKVSTMQVEKTDHPLSIALVYGRALFPMARADQMTVAHLVEFLGIRGHQLDLYTLDAQGEYHPEQIKRLHEICRKVTIHRQSLLRSYWGMLLSLFRGWPLQTGYFWNPNQAAEVQRCIADGEYDIVYVYYMRSAPALGDGFSPNQSTRFNGRKTASFIAFQLSQSLNWERMLAGCRSRFRRLFYLFETARVKKYESKIWQNSTKVVLIGQKDVEAVSRVCEEEKQPVLNNWVYGAHGTDINQFRASTEQEVVPGRLVFSGHMGVRTNVDAVVWFVTNCWDRIRERHPECELYIVGRSPHAEVLGLASKEKRIVVTGPVEDVGVYIRSAQVCLNPVHAAAGMQNKLIEYLASQRPIVATPAANEGILAPADSLVIAETADDFVNGVFRCLADPAAADVMARRGRDYVQQHWTWEAHFLKLEENFRKALEQ